MELGDQLPQIAEGQETAIQCPGWAVDRSAGRRASRHHIAVVTLATEESNTLRNELLARLSLLVSRDTYHGWLGQSVIETKAKPPREQRS